MILPSLSAAAGPALASLQDQLKTDQRQLVKDLHQQPTPTIAPDAALDLMTLQADRQAIAAAQAQLEQSHSESRPDSDHDRSAPPVVDLSL